MSRSDGEHANSPGGGPAGAVCRSCAFLAPLGGKRGRCRVASGMLHRPALPISDLSPACRHYEAAPSRWADAPEVVERPARREHRPVRAPVNHVPAVRALATSTPTERPSWMPAPDAMTAEHAAAWLPVLRMCAAPGDAFFAEVDSRVLDAACAALGVEPYQLGLEPGCLG